MGSFGGAEICEFVGLHILNSLVPRFGRGNVGLYRDDGLALLKNATARLGDKARKDLIKIFSDFHLKITAHSDRRTPNFLDITLNLTIEKFQPYRKSDNEPLDVHSHSSHPPSILRQIPAINRRISQLSSDQETYQTAIPTYKEALKRSDFHPNLQYLQNTAPKDNSSS